MVCGNVRIWHHYWVAQSTKSADFGRLPRRIYSGHKWASHKMNCFHERILELKRGSGKACPWERWRSGGRNLNMVFFPSKQQHIRVRNYNCIAGYTLTLDLGARGEDSNIFSTSSFSGEERSHAKESLVQKYLLVVRKNLTSFDSYEESRCSIKIRKYTLDRDQRLSFDKPWIGLNPT